MSATAETTQNFSFEQFGLREVLVVLQGGFLVCFLLLAVRICGLHGHQKLKAGAINPNLSSKP